MKKTWNHGFSRCNLASRNHHQATFRYYYHHKLFLHHFTPSPPARPTSNGSPEFASLSWKCGIRWMQICKSQANQVALVFLTKSRASQDFIVSRTLDARTDSLPCGVELTCLLPNHPSFLIRLFTSVLPPIHQSVKSVNTFIRLIDGAIDFDR